MASAGGVNIQGCALRIAALNSDGSITASGTSGMIVDDLPFLKFTAKPNTQAGVEITPISACGAPLISYKDYDRAKRWDCTLEIGDADFDKWVMVGGGSELQAAMSAGRTFTDGVLTLNSTTITSAASASFVATDVGRSLTGTGIPASTYIARVISSTSAVMSAAASATEAAESVVLGALAARTVAYQFPHLLSVPNANGVSLEIWQKIIVRGSESQATTPYPSVGGTPVGLPPSGYLRWGIFRFIPTPQDIDIEDKEGTRMFSGWAIENPMFGTGPVFDWTTSGVDGGAPLDTTAWCNAMMDYQLPSPRQAGYQATPAS